MAIQTEREIVRINEFEKIWKIKTNKNKFKMIPASKTHLAPLSVEDENMPFTQDVNILGLKLKCTGSSTSIISKINLAKNQLLKLRRFYKLMSELLVRLYITLIRPIMEYPPMPVTLASKTNILKVQRVQNIALKLSVRGTEDHNLTLQGLHEKFEVEAVNARLANRLTKLWDKIET